MALYRATSLFINRIMTGRIPAKAFVANTKNDGADPSGPDISAVVEGLALRDQIDPATLSFSMPTALRPPAEGFAGDAANPAQPTVRVVVGLEMVGMLLGAGLKGGPLYMNRNFEFDLPLGDNYASQIGRTLVAAGLAATAGALTNAQIPAALNTRWASVPVREPAV